MNVARPWPVRLRAIALISLAVTALIFGSCTCGGGTGGSTSATPSPTPHGSKATISICAVDQLREKDFPSDDCGTGTFAGLLSSAQVDIHAVDQNGHPLSKQKLTVTIRGPNAGSASVTTGTNGQATFSYIGTNLGSDTVSVAPTNSVSGITPASVIVEWIRNQAMTRPIIWVHGIHEDATNFAHEINHNITVPKEASKSSQQTWSSLLDALTTTYTPSAIQAFCYVDDIAWTNPTPGCASGESPPIPACSTPSSPSSTMCDSESSVDQNAVALATVVQDMYNQPQHHKVTLMAYSMGGAIVRTMMAGCLDPTYTSATGTTVAYSPTVYTSNMTSCHAAALDVDHVFLLNAAQEGSWLLQAESVTGLQENGLSSGAVASFVPVLPLIQSAFYDAVQSELGLNLNQPAIVDLTPKSQNITYHNSAPPPPGPNFYTFYGDISLGIQLQFFTATLQPQTVLPLGDLVFLPQADPPNAVPPWGGAALCGSCGGLSIADYEQSSDGTYHEWALAYPITISINGLIPLLSVPNAKSALQMALSSPVEHLNISQPASQDLGSTVQVKDITGLSGGQTTSMSNEIYLILAQDDGLE
ncbi:MAG: Ig-like domain-containing protein [Ktedonobacterales bacterium]